MSKNNEQERRVKIEEFHRPTSLSFLTRVDRVLNLTAIAREIKSCPHKQTFISRVNRHTDLTQNVEQKAFAQETGELLNELWYILGVGLGKHPRSPHKKFKYFYEDETERLKDKLDEIEELEKRAERKS